MHHNLETLIKENVLIYEPRTVLLELARDVSCVFRFTAIFQFLTKTIIHQASVLKRG